MKQTQKHGVIHVLLMGRLGNNMFQYAFARALQKKFYPKYRIAINVSYFQRARESLKLSGLEDHLHDFCIDDVIYEDTHPHKVRTFPQWCLGAIGKFAFDNNGLRNIKNDAKYFQPIYNFCGIYHPITAGQYIEPRFAHSRNIVIKGFFQHVKYFDSIRDILLEEFTPKSEVLPNNKAILDDINVSESVCVHIRRGDYTSIPQFNVCKEEYFVTAMKAIREELPNCKFFVFSDDVEDVKKNMHFPFDVTYERGNDPVWENLRLMYSCKHFIISNSSFSWWAQYLSRNPNKICYAPTPWLRDSEKFEGLYLPYMRTIECHKP